jgi:hypothetical protein
VQWSLGRGVGELGDGSHYPAPRRRPIIIARESEIISSGGAFLECLLAVALEHQLRRSPNINLRYHAAKTARPASIKVLRPVSVAPQADGRYAAGKVSRLEATMIWRARYVLIGGIALVVAGGLVGWHFWDRRGGSLAARRVSVKRSGMDVGSG